MNSEDIRNERAMFIYKLLPKIIVVLLFALAFALIVKDKNETIKNIEMQYKTAMELIENEGYMLVIDGYVVEKGVFDTAAPGLEFVYKVKYIDYQEKIIYLKTRKII